MSQDDLERMVAARELERVGVDPETARIELEQARLHVASAAEISERDPVAAFSIGYDSIRKAIAAHMRARGYRLPRGPGHHVRTGSYARAALDGAQIDEHLDAFAELRQLRNQGEYDALLLDAGDVAEVLAHADAIIRAIERSL